MTETQPFRRLHEALRRGVVSRREFIQRAAALGVAPAVVGFVLQATPTAVAAASVQEPAARPAAGTASQRRGAGGELKILQWQAPAHASAHNAGGTNDLLAAALVSEPLLSFLPDATLIPTLAREVPSLANGLLAADLTTVTYRLLPGVTWSDGVPFTAGDVAFTWRWITDPANQAITAAIYAPVTDVVVLDDLTVTIVYAAPNPAWYLPFTGSVWGAVYPEHILAAGAGAGDAFRLRPVGTGPFVVEAVVPNDRIEYVANERYREPTKPAFARVNLKGGGDAASAARAVLQTGDFDFAWALLVEPDILATLARGGKGRLVTIPGTTVQRIDFNFSDPARVVDGQRSQWQTPHPFLTDKAVRRAMSLAIDRMAISTQFYDGPPGEPPTANILAGIPALASPNPDWAFDLAAAGQLLDDAGWTLTGGGREKNGVRLELTFVTAVNPVLQKIQQLAKYWWESIGIRVELKQLEAGVFFDTSPGNEQSVAHFYEDVQMYASGPGSPFPLDYMNAWYSDGGENIAQEENGWARLNVARYHDPAYDRLYEAAARETDPARAAALFIAMNDHLIDDVAVLPLVKRAAEKYGIANTLRAENVAASSWEVIYWNIANWNRVD